MKFLTVGFIGSAIIATAFSLPNNAIKDCAEQGDCLSGPENCNDKCGCDRSVAYTYNATTDECTVDVQGLMMKLVEKYDIGEKIRVEADQVFKGILVSAMLIITCACISVISVCVYCCRINYSDYKLESDVKALAKKCGRDKIRKASTKQKPDPKAESCNVIVEEAGLFVC